MSFFDKYNYFTSITAIVCRIAHSYNICNSIPIPQSNPGVVTCMENTKHNLETGDTVTFKEIVGMTTINDTTHKVKGERILRYAAIN